MSILDNLLGNVINGDKTVVDSVTVTISCEGCNGTITLPIPPQEFSLSVQQKNQTVNINNAGELNMIGKTGLKTIDLSSFFPSQQYAFAQNSGTYDTPYAYIEMMDTWRTSGYPCHISISDSPIDMDCLIGTLKYGERDASGDVYYDVSLTEYRQLEKQAETKVTDTDTGLCKRPDVVWNKDTFKKNLTYYPGDNIMDVASRAAGKAITVNNKTYSHLDVYKKIIRRGGLNTGDVIKMTTMHMTINDGDDDVLS